MFFLTSHFKFNDSLSYYIEFLYLFHNIRLKNIIVQQL